MLGLATGEVLFEVGLTPQHPSGRGLLGLRNVVAGKFQLKPQPGALTS